MIFIRRHEPVSFNAIDSCSETEVVFGGYECNLKINDSRLDIEKRLERNIANCSPSVPLELYRVSVRDNGMVINYDNGNADDFSLFFDIKYDSGIVKFVIHRGNDVLSFNTSLDFKNTVIEIDNKSLTNESLSSSRGEKYNNYLAVSKEILSSLAFKTAISLLFSELDKLFPGIEEYLNNIMEANVYSRNFGALSENDMNSLISLKQEISAISDIRSGKVRGRNGKKEEK